MADLSRRAFFGLVAAAPFGAAAAAKAAVSPAPASGGVVRGHVGYVVGEAPPFRVLASEIRTIEIRMFRFEAALREARRLTARALRANADR